MLTNDDMTSLPMPPSQSKAVFFQLGRRRSQHPPAPALYHSPASASSHSSTSTPQNVSQSPQAHHLQHTSIVLPADGTDDESSVLHAADTDDLTSHSHRQPLQSMPTPMKETSRSSLETPGVGRQMHLSRDHQSPWIASEYSVALRGGSESPGVSAYGTPKPFSLTQRDQRKDLVLSTLNSDPRPTTSRLARGTPHVQSRRQARLPTQSPSYPHATPSVANTSAAADEDSSFLSIASAEDLTTLNRANTSLPAIEQSSRLGGMKLQRHLHSLNTQQHLLIATLQDENESLRLKLASGSQLGDDPSMNPTESFDASRASSTQPAHADVEALQSELQMKEEKIASLLAQLEISPQSTSVSSPATPRASSRAQDVNDARELGPSPDLVAVQLELEQLQNVLTLRSTEVISLRSDLESAQASLQTQTREFQAKTEKLEADVLEILGSKESELETLKMEKAQLEKDKVQLVTDKDSDRLVTQKETDALEAALRALQSELEGIRVAGQESKAEAERLKALVAVKSREFESQAELIAQLSQPPSLPTLDASSTSLDDATAPQDTSSTIRETQQLRQTLVDQQSELHATKELLETERSEVTRIGTLLRQAEETIERLEAEIEKEREREEEQSIRIEEVEVKLEKAEDLVCSQEIRLKELESQALAHSNVVAELESARGQHRKEIEAYKRDVDILNSDIGLLHAQIDDPDPAEQIAALEAHHSQALEELQTRHVNHLASLESALEVAQASLHESQSTITQLRADLAQSRVPPSPPPAKLETSLTASTSFGTGEAEQLEHLGLELEAANFKIGRLEAELLSSPFKRTAIESRDLRIQVLEAMNSTLGARVSAIQQQQQSTPMGGKRSSPAMRRVDESSFVNESILSLKTPKMPGPMRRVSLDPYTSQTSYAIAGRISVVDVHLVSLSPQFLILTCPCFVVKSNPLRCLGLKRLLVHPTPLLIPTMANQRRKSLLFELSSPHSTPYSTQTFPSSKVSARNVSPTLSGSQRQKRSSISSDGRWMRVRNK